MRVPATANRLRGRLAQPWILIPVAALIAVGVWYGFFRNGSSKSAAAPGAAPTQQTFTVSRGTLQQTVTASGTIEPASTEDLNFTSPGTVTAVDVQAGQTVKAGQVLASLDSAQLQAAVAQAQQTVDQAAAKVDADSTSGASSTQLTADDANLASVRAQLTLAQQNLAGATLASPIDGTVAQVDLTVGQQLGSGGTSGVSLAGTATGSGRSNAATAGGTGTSGGSADASTSNAQIEVISTGSYVVALNLDTTDIAHVKTGQTALVTPTTSSSTGGRGGRGGFGGGGFGGGGFGGAGGGGSGGGFSGAGGGTTSAAGPSSSGQQVSGTVTSVGLIAQASSGVATFPVQVTVAGSPADFHAGAIADVDIVYAELQNVLEVPSLAIDRAGPNPTVTVLVNGRKETRTVQLGLSSGEVVQVVSGLAEGDTVVAALPGASARAATRARFGTGGTSGSSSGSGRTQQEGGG